jgi:NADH-quinone oxidoreductase subunit F/NADP-reducing hydrogenase subunit HndC
VARIQKEDLEAISEQKQHENKNWIKVGMSTCGLAAGSQAVYDALYAGIQERGLDVEIRKAGCIGICSSEPLVDICVDGVPRTMYGHINSDSAEVLLDSHVMLKRVVKRLAIPELDHMVTCHDSPKPLPTTDVPNQYKIVTRNCGSIDPDSLEEYIGTGGYVALRKCLFEMNPDKVIDEIKKSGLRGRGGAGYPTGLKWELTRKAEGTEKHVICNGDEGDPGAYMDRSVLEGDPFSVIEGMTIAGYAIGVEVGFLYIRAEYPLAVTRMEAAIRQAKQAGLLGKNILDSDFSFNLEVRLGAGAFVCGEETALIASVEGQRGTPRPRPPYPSVSGLWGNPTSINNVETLANIAPIIAKGAKWFQGIGMGKSTGTKVFALTGKIQRPGLVEIPMGTSLHDIVYGIGGGPLPGKTIKAAQTGGPSGGLIPAEQFDTPVTYEHLQAAGSMVGSGGMIVLDNDDSIVDIVKFYLGFCVEESCGKCAPCRIGGTQMLQILDRITKGQGQPSDLEYLDRISRTMKSASLCGLGQSAPNPVLSSLRYFRHEYEEALDRARAAV